jgi:GNAT superfamily N-acetyltransferase
MSTTVRRASLADTDALAALRRAWVEEQAGIPVDDPGFEQDLVDWLGREHDQRVTWLATAGDAPVGMLNMLVFTRMPRPGRPPSRWGYLANFFVLGTHRDAGLGARLLSACVAYADDHDFVRIVLSPSARSVTLYRRAGFRAADDLMIRQPGTLK